MTTCRPWIAAAAALLAVGCGSSSSSAPNTGPSGPAVPGIALPREISALPSATAGASSLVAGRGGAALLAPARALRADATSDYSLAQTVKYVDERALSQFEILNTIFSALAQTKYDDAANVNQGPYGAIVGWVESHNGQAKQLKSWVVDSTVVEEDGRSVNVVKAWMKDMMPAGSGSSDIIKAKVKIYEAPVQNADGTYADYGVWRMDVKFDDAASMYFVAEARRENGLSVVMVHQLQGEGETRGILRRSATSGYGKVDYPDWGHSSTPTPTTVAYVYDAQSVALRKGGVTTYKDRLASVDVVNRYKLFDAITGDDVARTHRFGFPIRFGDQSQYGSYGAWQGRHQIWAGSSSGLPAGTIVHRGDAPGGGQGEQYTVSPAFTGVLVKRTLVDASLQDIKNVVVETWTSRTVQLAWDAAQSRWTSCFQVVSGGMPSCSGPTTLTSAELATFARTDGDLRKQVSITPPSRLMGQALVSTADGTIYLATPGNPPVSTGVVYAPQNGDQVFVSVNGPIYIVFDGTSWKQKTVVSFDASTNTATFGATDGDFTLELDREYYVNNPGASYVVKRTAGGTTARVELQSVANPGNAASFAGMTFRSPWTTGADYHLVTTAGTNYLKLVNAGGQPVTTPLWGLDAYVGGVRQPDQYNWDYPQGEQSWAVQQFLVDSAGQYVMLDDPIRLQPLDLAGYPGRTFSLQFDGNWISGLPDIWNDLQAANFDVTPAIEAKLVSIPGGTVVVDAGDPTRQYVFKQLEVSEFLKTLSVAPAGLDLAPALGLDVASVPGYVENGMGTVPNAPVKYTEGQLVP